MDKPKRHRPPTCGCGAPKVDGRCSARPSCSDFTTVAKIGLVANAQARQRAAAATKIGLGRAEAVAGEQAANPHAAHASAVQRQRSINGWRTRQQGGRNV